MTPRIDLGSRLSGLFGPDPTAARQSFLALSLGLLGSLAAGLMLGAMSGTLEDLPGLLVLIPGAIALRGTTFGALGARLGTAIHTGTFSLSRRVDTVVGQNVLAAGVITVVGSVALGVLAKVVSIAFGLEHVISAPELITISVVGGLLASSVIVVITVTMAGASVRYGWDSDNVMAPLVTGAADMLTLPAIYAATLVVGHAAVTTTVTVVSVLAVIVVVGLVIRTELAVLRRIVAESLPVVVGGAVLSLVAGVALETRLGRFADYPSLLVLAPLVLASSGSVGGVLASRLTSKLHLGTIDPTVVPSRPARLDIGLAYSVALPVLTLGGLLAHVVSLLAGLADPGVVDMVTAAFVGGTLAVSAATIAAYGVAVLSYRVGLDPDNYAIPFVTSTIDLLGSVSYIIVVTLAVPSGVV